MATRVLILLNGLRAHIRARINRCELTGRDLACKAGLQQSHVSNFLNGRRGLSAEALDRLLDAVQIFVADHLRPAAIAAGVSIQPSQRFGLHNLRHSLSTFLVNTAKIQAKTVQGTFEDSNDPRSLHAGRQR